MPYYVYKIFPPKRLELIDEFDTYRDAKTFTRGKRKNLIPEDGYAVRMVFAPGREHAERLLKEFREARPLGEDA
jgi:putative salt-induced outer membrane protein YdiY